MIPSSPGSLPHEPEASVRRRAQPGEHLALALAAAGAGGERARLLERLLDLLCGGARLGGGDLRAQACAVGTARDALDQCPRALALGSLCIRRRHHSYRGGGRRTGPPRVRFLADGLGGLERDGMSPIASSQLRTCDVSHRSSTGRPERLPGADSTLGRCRRGRRRCLLARGRSRRFGSARPALRSSHRKPAVHQAKS
jgi:hypothetical protein